MSQLLYNTSLSSFCQELFEIFFIASFKATSASVQLQGFALLYLSDNDVYITTNLHLCQHFYKIFLIFFLPLINSDLSSQMLILAMAYIYDFCRHGIYPYRHALAILMCLTLLNSFNHMKSFTMFIFSWLKFVKKRGTSIYLLRVYVMPSTLCIHCVFLLWHYS